jgi:nucleoside-diphosphate-sugar epimerase
MAEKVLVTGSSGHLGYALMLTLPSLGYEAVGIDILAGEATHHVGSISDREFVQSVFASGVQHVIHTATLHKPHVESHPREAFVETNIRGTLVLLEEASTRGVRSFIFTSTTSAFGAALSPKAGRPAAWIDEGVVPIPKNIYGVTKVAAEDLCRLVHGQTGMPTLVLRTSRFFPEADDDDERRMSLADENLKVLELCYRRVDVADVVSACACAMRRAKDIGWGRYIVSAPSPFRNDAATLKELDGDAAAAVVRAVPECRDVFEQRGWGFLGRIDRVYDSGRAVRDLGWEPQHTFASSIGKLQRGEEWRSQLTFKVGKRGYHAVSTGIYTQREE